MPASMDVFANKAYATVTESGANTLTFSEIQTNVSVFEKMAWIIHRIEWYLSYATQALLIDAADTLQLALTASQSISSLALNSPSVIDLYEQYKFLATAVGYHFSEMPIIRDFTALPGGGLIVAPRPLYIAAKGTGLASAATGSCRFYFTVKQLKADEYLELVDFYRIVQ